MGPLLPNTTLFRSDLVAADLDLNAVLPDYRIGRLRLDTAQLNGFELGAIRVAAKDTITVDNDLHVGAGGNITLFGPVVQINADLTARAGTIRLGNVLEQASLNRVKDTTFINAPTDKVASVTVAKNALLDTTGLWTNLKQNLDSIDGLPWLDGGSVSIRSTEIGRAHV